MPAGYTIDTQGSIAMAAATAKTILNVINSSTGLFRIVELSVSFDGATATAVPATVELCKSTQAGNGTGSTATTPTQVRGATRTIQLTATRNYTTEPTTLTVAKRWLVPVFNGLLVVQFPLGREPEQITASNAYALRVTAPAVVNCAAYLECEEG